MRILAALALAVLLAGGVCSAAAEYSVKPCVVTAGADSTSIYGTIKQSLFLNDGPGTRRYFRELGSFNSRAGESVHILAKAWDPNNAIWWIKVEYPAGTGMMGWTGYKRFDASSFDINKVPAETWYEY